MNALTFRAAGVLSIGIGLLLMRIPGATAVRATGLGVWCFGALLVLDTLLQRDGLPAQVLWGAGFSTGTYLVAFSDLPEHVSTGPAATIIASATIVLGAACLVRPLRREPPLPELLRELSAKAEYASRPQRPADPPAEVARIHRTIDSFRSRLRAENPRLAAELSRLHDSYRSLTAPRPSPPRPGPPNCARRSPHWSPTSRR